MGKPLVSVICLCFNHGRFINQAIESVVNQTYDNIELIVIDDTSHDESQNIIEKASKIHGFKTIFNTGNLGNCKSFNNGFRLSKGKYLIDLAADDLLEPDRIQIGVEELERKGDCYGVHFCDVELLDENGKSLRTHYKRDAKGNLQEEVPSGDIYTDLVARYLISAPSMMMSRKVLEELNGYDEQLSYEDFDFWVRSARNYQYTFSDKVLVKKLILKDSLSSIQYHRKNKHALSTARVCEKIQEMNKNENENQALLRRVNYELKWDLVTENWEAVQSLIELKEKLGNKSIRLLAEKMTLSMKPHWYWIWAKVL